MCRDPALVPFLPAIGDWFESTFAEPTPAQRGGWDSIRTGSHTLILAPTGSGKTLAAFLAALDHLWRRPADAAGVGILYISPLKALNQDVARNLEWPLAEIEAGSARRGERLRRLSVGLRTGDTTPTERARMLRRPPDILITTPESLHILLAGRSRGHFRGVSHVIVDEIHAVCPNKRGVFLSVLLERLEQIADRPFTRIGLSATQRPLDVVARYLGGLRRVEAGGESRWEPRPVRIVDAGMRRRMDLTVAFPSPRSGEAAQPSIWPAIEDRLLELIEAHRSTIVFANNRRVVERLTARLNGEGVDRSDQGTVVVERESGDSPVIVSHHGSLSLERRRATETALKEGRIRAVVATASLELGIDMGAVDLVCQVESPGSVSRGLQRVGRAGHAVGGSSKGRMFAKSRSDLLESAALAREMVAGEVEWLRLPSRCLDILAQQIVACVAVEPWDARRLFELFRGAEPYRDLTTEAFESVLAMVSGRLGPEFVGDLRPRISWDRIHNRLEPLPGTAALALTGGGAIGDTGQFAVVHGEGGAKLGELDEEFVLERRPGEVFTLGTSAWRIESIDTDRVTVSAAERNVALVPFWRGEAGARSAELGDAVGRLIREVRERIEDGGLLDWLAEECRLEPDAAKAVRRHVRRQVEAAGTTPDDQSLLVDAFRDPSGDWLIAVLSPFGSRFHHALRVVVVDRLRDRFGLTPASIHADDGLVLRFPGGDDPPPVDLLDGLTVAEADVRLRSDVPTSAAFGLRFRQAAARALLMPRSRPGRRTPLWLQRLRAKDLLEIARRVPDFPIIAEALRETLVDDFEIDRFLDRVRAIEVGTIRVVTRIGEAPSPFSVELMLPFTTTFLYEWDAPRPERGASEAAPNALLDDLLDPSLAAAALGTAEGREAIRRLDDRLRGRLLPPRDAAEAIEWVRALGDVRPDEADAPTRAHLAHLEAEGRLRRVDLAGAAGEGRWVTAEDEPRYASAFDPIDRDSGRAGREAIASHYLRTRALVGIDDLVQRYPIERAEALDLLERWVAAKQLVALPGPGGNPAWADARNLESVRRSTQAARRRSTAAVAPEVFCELVAERQGLLGERPPGHVEGVREILGVLRGRAIPAALWEAEVLPCRVPGYRPEWLDEALAGDEWLWQARGAPDDRTIAFLDRGFPINGGDPDSIPAEGPAAAVLDRLRAGGAAFPRDIAASLGLPIGEVRELLDDLTGRGLVTNDRFDPVRGRRIDEAGPSRPAEPSRPGRRLRRSRSLAPPAAEGRWSALDVPAATAGLDAGRSDAELGEWAAALLDRHGVLCREILALEPAAPPWRELAAWLDRAEWREEVRRGYFVEALSGLQYADPEAVDRLRALADDRGAAPAEVRLVSSLDPANLYGSGAPLDAPADETSAFRLIRSASTWVALARGRPVLSVESAGRRLAWPSSATEQEIRPALAQLPRLASPARRTLRVETINGLPAWTHPAHGWLEEVGFVRDPPALTLYLGF